MQTRDKVSIQLPLGGHSFSLDSLPADDVAMVEVVVDTHKVVLAPREEVPVKEYVRTPTKYVMMPSSAIGRHLAVEER